MRYEWLTEFVFYSFSYSALLLIMLCQQRNIPLRYYFSIFIRLYANIKEMQSIIPYRLHFLLNSNKIACL